MPETTNPESQPSAPPQRTWKPVDPPPPPASLPKAPSRARAVRSPAPVEPPPAPGAPAPSKWRELSTDPEERAKQRKLVSAEAESLIEMASGVASAFPPKRPLDEMERAMITVPLEETLFKYGLNLDPAVSLGIAVLTIAFLRWQEHKRSEAQRKKDQTVLVDHAPMPKVS